VFSLIPLSNPPGVLFRGREETIHRKTVLRFCQTPAGRRGWHRGLCAGCDAALPQLFQGFPRQLQEFPRRNMYFGRQHAGLRETVRTLRIPKWGCGAEINRLDLKTFRSWPGKNEQVMKYSNEGKHHEQPARN
jgi:hypothetical protein